MIIEVVNPFFYYISMIACILSVIQYALDRIDRSTNCFLFVIINLILSVINI
jgi:hypothetical protein